MNNLKLCIFLYFISIIIISCDKEETSVPKSIDFVSSFSTEKRPHAIAINKEKGYIYVANLNPANNDYNAKIEKFNLEGIFLETTVDFTTFDKGNFIRYIPIDITIDDKQNLYVLVNPLIKQIDDIWTTPTGFCILKFDYNDYYKKELDLSHIDGEGDPSSIAYSDNHIFVTNGRIIKKISFENEQVYNIPIPLNEDTLYTWPNIHTTDMEINSEGTIYLTGQAAFGYDSVGCHITKFDTQTNKLNTSYSKGWTCNLYARLNNPGLAINSTGNIYLATFYVMSLELFNKNGDFILKVDINEKDEEKETRPIDVALYNSKIYVVDNFNNLVFIYKEN